MAKPSILLIPGSYCLLSLYQPIFNGVTKAGYDINGIHLPTIGPKSRRGNNSPAPSMYDDAHVIAKEVEALADQGKDVILVGHSYGGICMSQCTSALSETERQAQGKPGGIAQLGYMAALVPAIGQSAADLLGVFPDKKRPPVSIDDNGWMLMEDPGMTAQLIMQDVPVEVGEATVKAFAKHSARSFADKLTHAGYKDIPVSYLVCEEDMAGPQEIIQYPAIEMIEQASGRKVDVTTVQAGHMMNVSKEKETVEWILDIARKVEERGKFA